MPTCTYCNGEGHNFGHVCPQCNGSGLVFLGFLPYNDDTSDKPSENEPIDVDLSRRKDVSTYGT